jgi:hypothetical protein
VFAGQTVGMGDEVVIKSLQQGFGLARKVQLVELYSDRTSADYS